ncbi:TonB-dependent receptor plug domain-containing protein [Coralloluteibacterium stylophorae]|uniref:TonB-dependent receptor n=1 Tax=Coralloluteibacterium stylophorae TaxID=1776034 RepID=A0A8J7VTY5_9GAMM|nr:TonB-dependent receptor [Coralloluteibacterium stylophorae]MBS7458972.1 TonB-dependent receptor [Coralloluteibacterium stylophorae]
MSPTHARLRRSRLTAALLAAVAMPLGANALAQDAPSTSTGAGTASTLDRVTVTGSLIPQTEIETFTPVTTITADDIQARGFTSIGDVLQQSSMSTGGFQGGQTSASFTQGAEAVSMFSLDPGYTKYLINGRPMANYPALYNGSDAFNNISGIPVDLVDRVEILPGGQSSLYGSDAIAGVVNVILKKSVDAATLTVRGGTFTEGGGNSLRLSFSDGFEAVDGRLNVLYGLQYETRNPIWGYQRDLTDSYNTDGYTAPVAGRDFLVYSGSGDYYFMDPANCGNVSGLFDGTEGLQTREGYGQYCGSFASPGYRTLRNGKDSTQVYTHATFDVNDNLQLYADYLFSHESVDYATGSSYTWWGTGSKYGYYYDPALDDLVNLQRGFAPEDIGGNGYDDIMNTDRTNSYMVTFGGSGFFGDSDWEYDLSATRSFYRLKEHGWARFDTAINSYFENTVLGPQLGTTADGFPIFAPDYAAFYQPIDPADFAAFTGYTNSSSKTWDNMLRAQVTNSALFELPGGDAGLAVVLEGGNQGWDYSPDARLLPETADIWGTTAVSGSGHRSRVAATTELRMPLLDPLTVTASARYDEFDAYGTKTDKPTYSIGIEYRPVDSLLFRGKYGTAFRAPTLADQFQGVSGFYSSDVDYWRCYSEEGYDPADTEGCSFENSQYFGTQEGNPDLEPIEADVWNAGVVWAPMHNLSVSVDYYSWDIRNEVDTQSSDQLLLQEFYCRSGQQDIASASCQQALDWVIRDATGALDEIYTPKVNVAQQTLEAVTASINYSLDIGRWGMLRFNGNYTNMLSHFVQPLPDEGKIDLLRDPYYMWVYDAYAKTRADASVAWDIGDWTTTLYANRIGKTPNYLAYYAGDFGYEHSSGATAGWWQPYITYNASVNWRATDDIQFSLMVNNVLNEMPDDQAYNFPGTSSTPYNNYLYDIYGRSVMAEMRFQFGN